MDALDSASARRDLRPGRRRGTAGRRRLLGRLALRSRRPAGRWRRTGGSRLRPAVGQGQCPDNAPRTVRYGHGWTALRRNVAHSPSTPQHARRRLRRDRGRLGIRSRCALLAQPAEDGDTRRYCLGASGAASLAGLLAVLGDPSLRPICGSRLGLGSPASSWCIVTEGVTDRPPSQPWSRVR